MYLYGNYYIIMVGVLKYDQYSPYLCVGWFYNGTHQLFNLFTRRILEMKD